MVTVPKPPACENCHDLIDTEDKMWHDPCTEFPAWGHMLSADGLYQLWRYLEGEDGE